MRKRIEAEYLESQQKAGIREPKYLKFSVSSKLSGNKASKMLSSTPEDDDDMDPNEGDPDDSFGETKKTPKRKAKGKKSVRVDYSSSEDWEASPSKKQKSARAAKKSSLRLKTDDESDSVRTPTKARKSVGRRTVMTHEFDSDDSEVEGQFVAKGADFLKFGEDRNGRVTARGSPHSPRSPTESADTMVFGPHGIRDSKLASFKVPAEFLKMLEQPSGRTSSVAASTRAGSSNENNWSLHAWSGYGGPSYEQPAMMNPMGGMHPTMTTNFAEPTTPTREMFQPSSMMYNNASFGSSLNSFTGNSGFVHSPAGYHHGLINAPQMLSPVTPTRAQHFQFGSNGANHGLMSGLPSPGPQFYGVHPGDNGFRVGQNMYQPTEHDNLGAGEGSGGDTTDDVLGGVEITDEIRDFDVQAFTADNEDMMGHDGIQDVPPPTTDIFEDIRDWVTGASDKDD